MNKNEIIELTNKIHQEGCAKYNLKYYPLNVVFKLTGRVAGRAHLTKNTVNFNITIAQTNDSFEQTVYHEVAHMLAYRAFNDNGHGYFWKKVMVEFGKKPNRCHNYDTTEAKRAGGRKYYIYTCNCNHSHEVSSIVHNRIQRKTNSYSCTLCKGKLVYSREL